VSAGGSTIGSLGPPAGEPPRRVSLRAPGGAVLGEVSLRDESLSTSGNWMHRRVVDGRVVGHVLDPRSGEPSDAAVVSVTVVAPLAGDSDALATACCVLGPEASEPILRAERARAYFVVRGPEGDLGIVRAGAP
jgi:thiamine biosynthesis lipoprotein